MIVALLVLAGVALALAGVLLLTQATQGVGLIALACYLGTQARLVQAAAYNRQHGVAQGAHRPVAGESGPSVHSSPGMADGPGRGVSVN